ncbi:MAG: carbonic anhydrase [Chitinophagaceae bacterium]|nr:carbonic anhydrase [Chitinophagaceae bacterium]
MESYSKLLLQNKAWAAEMKQDDPHFFERLAKDQTPAFLWIGCSDSRVPANEITGTFPGEIFVHRNIANLVVKDDINLLSVLEYAVVHLKVQHVIVCGHYGCGGVKAALTDKSYGILDPWLKNIKNIIAENQEELQNISDVEEQCNRLVELSVKKQVYNLSLTDTLRKVWGEENRPRLHGWVYSLKDGLLKQIHEVQPPLAAKEPGQAADV